MRNMKYEASQIEPKWQKYWEDKGFNSAEDFSKAPKKYLLIEFPYPSGQGLHVGHCRSYSAMDALARKYRLQGFNVLFPIGWDAFGLPTENYAIKTGAHPKTATQENVANFKRQVKSLGLSFDWQREINTTDPDYYKWTQWIFLKLLEKGLAYRAKMPINWCPSCKTGLANEEVVNGRCERCKAIVTQREIEQWMLKITQYADRLIDDLEKVNYLDNIKKQQIDWIGKSFGTEVDFIINDSKEKISVFTTRPDTLFGVTAVVLALEHNLVKRIVKKEYQKKVNDYIKSSKEKSEFERTKIEKEKTGVFTGSFCINPVSNEKVPIWIGDYVVAAYGGGAVMMVPAHDKRDYEFAKKYDLKIKEVIKGGDVSKKAFVDYGVLINSSQFNGLNSQKAIEKISFWLEKNGFGKKKVHYKLRDWVFSRQHYWGEPIPVIHCEKCGIVPVSEKDLPIKLPHIEKYKPTTTGQSPLSALKDWINVSCPKCKGKAKRETDTMPNWAGSNWYYLRYCDPNNEKELIERKKAKYWMPVDWYNGGMEHTTLHLLYSRFIYKFLFDINAVFEPEPYQKRTSHGMVLAEDGRKMSKSFGNVISPDYIINEYGADTLRMYEMFMGPFEQTIEWNSAGVKGVNRFLHRIWNLVVDCLKNKGKSSQEAIRESHKLNKKVEKDIEAMKFNTAIATFMEFVNFCYKNKKDIDKDVLERMLLLLFPFTPHIAEELWNHLGHKESINKSLWPKYDSKLVKEEIVTLIVQINGKVRDRIELEMNTLEQEVKDLTLARDKVKKLITGKKVKKIIFISNKIINIVI